MRQPRHRLKRKSASILLYFGGKQRISFQSERRPIWQLYWKWNLAVIGNLPEIEKCRVEFARVDSKFICVFSRRCHRDALHRDSSVEGLFFLFVWKIWERFWNVPCLKCCLQIKPALLVYLDFIKEVKTKMGAGSKRYTFKTPRIVTKTLTIRHLRGSSLIFF